MLVGNKMKKYTNDKSTQIVLALLKAHGIKKVIASPGTTNIALVASMQHDSWFEMYSSVDERSAAYMACGMASECGEPVVLTCTGATASRNYFPGLTEAYYRKLPVLAITGSHGDEQNGHLHPQSLDRRFQPTDTVKMSVSVSKICEPKDEWSTVVKVNTALLELKHRGKGPVHINLRGATYAGFDTIELPNIRKIDRIDNVKSLPEIKAKSIAIFIGAHREFTLAETSIVEKFCEKYNAAVFCDHTSGYRGKYKVLYALPGCQTQKNYTINVDLLIHLGEISGDFYSTSHIVGLTTWRVSEDGEIRDLFHNLSLVCEMSEYDFFEFYNNKKSGFDNLTLYEESHARYIDLLGLLPELPWGNIWCAQQMHAKLPKDSIIHFSIFNSLRSWNFFEVDNSIITNCNVGGFGIDGPVSTLIGASLTKPQKMHYGIIGDLAFFYDLNSLGNRHIGNNIRILIINNGVGTEFKNYDHPASTWGEDADLYIAAGGHFGKQSSALVKNYAENLGFEYLYADCKEAFLDNLPSFITDEQKSKPMIFELFTTPEDESNAINIVRNIVAATFKDKTKQITKSIAKSMIRKISK